MMKRYKCIVSYDGTNYSGYQMQPKDQTIQEEIEKVLSKIHKREVKTFASGRTDAGVHAKGQVLHFDSELPISLDKFPRVINGFLPDDILIVHMEEVSDDFHARYDAIGKEYRYFVRYDKERDPFTRNYHYHYRYSLDIEAMREAAKDLIGEHDFTSFCSLKTATTNKIRTIHSIDIVVNDNIIEFRFKGNGFLYNMVRILVGTLLEIGNGRKAVNSIPEILKKKDPRAAGKKAPAHGLYLWNVFY